MSPHICYMKLLIFAIRLAYAACNMLIRLHLYGFYHKHHTVSLITQKADSQSDDASLMTSKLKQKLLLSYSCE